MIISHEFLFETGTWLVRRCVWCAMDNTVEGREKAPFFLYSCWMAFLACTFQVSVFTTQCCKFFKGILMSFFFEKPSFAGHVSVYEMEKGSLNDYTSLIYTIIYIYCFVCVFTNNHLDIRNQVLATVLLTVVMLLGCLQPQVLHSFFI